MKKSKAASALDMLEKELELVSPEEKLIIIGGSGYSSTGYQEVSVDCVIKVFDYLDGSGSSYNTYMDGISGNLGYDPNSTGGIYTDDFATVAGYGGLTLTDLGSGGIPINPSTGGSLEGNPIMMTFNGANGMDHAVVVEGVRPDGSIDYYDPTTNSTGNQPAGQWTGFYEIEN